MPGEQQPDTPAPRTDSGEVQVSPEAGLASEGLRNGYDSIICSTGDSSTKTAGFVLKLFSAFGRSL